MYVELRLRPPVQALRDPALYLYKVAWNVLRRSLRGARRDPQCRDPAEFERLFQVNLMGPLHGMQAAIRAMRKTGGGTIVNISSGTSRIVVPFLGGAYPALKRRRLNRGVRRPLLHADP